jgi:hypothetical protein
MRIKFKLILPLILFTLFIANASATTIYVSPSSIVDSTLTKGKTFTVNIAVSDAKGLNLVMFDLSWNSKILNLTSLVGGDMLGKEANVLFIYRPIDYVSGRVESVSYAPMSNVFINGNGVIAKATFKVIGAGDSNLGINSALIYDSVFNAAYPSVKNGYFKNTLSRRTMLDITTIMDFFKGMFGLK